MDSLTQVACIAGLGVLVQFVAAIIGPGMLRFSSTILVLLALAVVGGWAMETYASRPAPLIHPVDQDTAVNFGILAAALFVTHFIIRGLFRSMARASRA